MIVLDTETTGLDAEKNSLLSIGALEFENPENQFYGECRIWDGAEVDPIALTVCGFSESEVADKNKQLPKQLLESFFVWAKEVKNTTVAGHNVLFDVGFLEAEAQRAGLGYPFPHRVIDTHSLAWMHLIQARKIVPEKEGRSGVDSDFVFKYVGITEERGEHNALEDAKLTAEAISRLAYGRQLLDEYRQFPIPWK